jgi:hypothetical protein
MIENFIEIKLPSEDAFLKIKETLTRIGVASNKDKKLFQSCHILHKKGKYYIVHFKELFALDGRDTTLDEEDIGRRNSIARLLHEWGLCTIVGLEKKGDRYIFPETMKVFCEYSKIKVISYSQKNEWKLESKYSIGKKKV